MSGSISGAQAPNPSEPVSPPVKTAPKSLDKRIADLFGIRAGLLTEIGRGKDKLVIGVQGGKQVFLFAQKSFLGVSQRIIEKEIAFVNSIKSKLEKVGGDTTNLAVDIKEGPSGKRYWTMEKAVGNLEKKILEKSNNWDSCKSYCSGLVNGMVNLHKVDGVHGDLKLENLLLFPNDSDESKCTVKIADFGKSAKVRGDKIAGAYSGNTRYGPPEGSLSKASDVYGTGICLIRILEEQFLSDTTKMLISVPKGMDKQPPAHVGRRGVEKFLLDNAMFTRTYEQKAGFQGKILDFVARVRTAFGLPSDKLEAEQVALNGYIRALSEKMVKTGRLSKDKAEHLTDLLQKMTSVDPSRRPSMVQVQNDLKEILAYVPTPPPR